MSLARAFTTRRLKRNDASKEQNASPARSLSLRKPGSPPIQRSAISGPVALLSTTNPLSYNAPDVPSIRHVSSSSSSAASSSGEDSDVTSASSMHETDASSVSSGSPTSPKPNHLSTYFANATTVASQAQPTAPVPPTLPAQSPRRSESVTELRKKISTELKPDTVAEYSTPTLPKRALSHSKSAHVLAHQRSVRSSTSSSQRQSIEQRTSVEHRASADIFKVNEDPNHPFSNELQQLKEVVEEFGEAVAEVSNDADSQYLAKHNLAKFTVADYLVDIQPLVIAAFKHKQVVAVQAGWI